MKKMVVLILLLSGCASLTYDETLASYKQHCKNIGFKKGSEPFANCVMEQYKISK